VAEATLSFSHEAFVRARADLARDWQGTICGDLLLAFLEQQVMVDFSHIGSSSLIRVETPTVVLPFLNCFTDILVVANLHTDVFFQLNITFVALQDESGYNNLHSYRDLTL